MAARQLVRGMITQARCRSQAQAQGAGPRTEKLLIQGISMLWCSDFALVRPQ